MTRLRFALPAVLLLLAGCGNPFPKKPPAPTTPAAPTVDDRNTNYRPGQSTLRNALRSGERGAALNDFSQLQLLMFDYELTNNRMPTKEDTRNLLKGDAQNLLKKVDAGVIVLTGTTNRQGLWAYEIDADIAGGIVLANNAVSRATADEVKALIAQK